MKDPILTHKPIYITYFLAPEQIYPFQSSDIYDIIVENNYVLDSGLINKILEAEGIEYEPESLRIRTDDTPVPLFVKLPSNLEEKIDLESDWTICIMVKPIKKQDKEFFENYDGKLSLILKKIDTLSSDAPLFKSVDMTRSFKRQTTSFYKEPGATDDDIFFNEETQRIDLLILFSNPLVTKKRTSLHDPVDFEGEIVQLKRILGEIGRRIIIKVDVATKLNLRNYLQNSPPRIIHFICHGGYNKDKQDFFLAFENERLELDECEVKELREIISHSEEMKGRLELVFVNACHSEEVGKVFIDAGVNHVISVQSDLQIRDSVAQVFSELFYKQFFSGKSIENSFKNASETVKAKCQKDHIYSCCCNHRHSPNCKWFQEMIDNDTSYGHELHTSRCMCPRAIEQIHKSNCRWANDFLMQYTDDDYSVSKEVKTKKNISGKETFVCCCKPDLPHDETQKFIILTCQDEVDIKKSVKFDVDQGGKSIYKSADMQNTGNLNPRGLLIDKSNWVFSHIGSESHKEPLIAFNPPLYDLYNNINDENTKYIHIAGGKGSGKTRLIDHLIRLLYERGKFRESDSMLRAEFKKQSFHRFLNILFGSQHNKKNFLELNNHKQILIILEDCDQLISTGKHLFYDNLEELGSILTHSKIIITTNDTNLKPFQLVSFMDGRLKQMTLSGLKQTEVSKLIIDYLGSKVPSLFATQEVLIDSEICKTLKCLQKCSPGFVIEKCKKFHKDNIKGNLKWEKFIEEMESYEAILNAKDPKVMFRKEVEEELKIVEQMSPDFYAFLLITAYFPAGITKFDLNYMFEIDLISKEGILSGLGREEQPGEENLRRSSLMMNRIQKLKYHYWFEESLEYLRVKPNLQAELQDLLKEKNKLMPILAFYHYMSLVACNLKNYFLKTDDFLEELIECSAITKDGICPEEEQSDCIYLGENDKELLDMKNYIEIHKKNLNSSFQEERLLLLYKMISEDKYDDEESYAILGGRLFDLKTLMKDGLTVLKIVRESRIFEIIQTAVNICSLFLKIFEGQDYLVYLNTQLNLMQLALSYNTYFVETFKEEFKNDDEINEMENLVEINKEWISNIDDEIFQKLVSLEVDLVTHALNYAKSRQITDERKKYLRELIEKIEHSINEANELNNELSIRPLKKKFELLKAKIIVSWLAAQEEALMEEQLVHQTSEKNLTNLAKKRNISVIRRPQENTIKELNQSEIEMSDLSKFEELVGDFDFDKLMRLKMHSSLLLIQARLVFAQGGKPSIKEKEDQLMLAKNEIQMLQEQSKKYGKNFLSKTLEDVIRDYPLAFNKIYSSFFVYLHCDPLVYQENAQGPISALKPNIWLPRTLSQKLGNEIKWNKKVEIIVENFKIDTMTKILYKGAKVIYVSCELDNQGRMMLEKEKSEGMLESVPVKYWDDMLKKKPLDTSFNNPFHVAIIDCENYTPWENLFFKTIRIPYVVVFLPPGNSSEKLKSFTLKDWHLRREMKEQYTALFSCFLMENKRPEEAHSSAMEQLVKWCSSNWDKRVTMQEELKNFYGKPELKSNSMKTGASNFLISEGVPSFPANPETLKTFGNPSPLEGKNETLYMLLKLVAQPGLRINLFGSKGNDMLDLAKSVGSRLFYYNHFPDGMYVIDGAQHNYQNMNEILENVFREECFEDIIYREFLSNKKMFIIFNQFESLKEIEWMTLFIEAIESLKDIAHIIITSEKCDSLENSNIHTQFIEINDISAGL